MARLLSIDEAATELFEVAELIREASEKLDRVCCHGAAVLVSRVEAIPAQAMIERSLADAIKALAERLAAEAEEADVAAAEEADDARRANPFEPDYRSIA